VVLGILEGLVVGTIVEVKVGTTVHQDVGVSQRAFKLLEHDFVTHWVSSFLSRISAQSSPPDFPFQFVHVEVTPETQTHVPSFEISL
jgi:hypothetical protein